MSVQRKSFVFPQDVSQRLERLASTTRLESNSSVVRLALVVLEDLVEAIAKGTGAFQHGFTYQNHPVAMAAGNAVLDILEEQQLFARVVPAGREFFAALESLKQHPHVGDVRGLGLLAAVEFVKDKATREPFPREANVAGRIFAAAAEHGVLTYPI